MRIGLGVLGGLLFLVVVAWYWPLHRAHAELRGEYLKASDTAKALRADLEKTSGTLAATTKARDALSQKEAQRAANAAERARAMEDLYNAVQSNVRSRLDKNQVSLEKSDAGFSLTLHHRTLQKADSVDLTQTGEQLLCEALDPIKSSTAIRVRLQGLGTDAQSKSAALKSYKSALEVGAARAARAAPVATQCGLKHGRFIVEASTPPRRAETHTLRLVIEAEAPQE